MNYEDIEPPTPAIDILYREIVADYKAGKHNSQEEALGILESRYLFSFIDIKKELHGEFEVHPYYVYGEMGNLDEYIKICEKSENSPTPTEQDIFIQILNGVIEKVHLYTQKTDELKHIQSYADAAKCVYRQVEKVRKLSRMNRDSKILYEKYKAEIEAYILQNTESTIKETTKEQNPEPVKENDTAQVISEYIEREKMLPLFQRMYDDKIITGEKINGKWVLNKYKKGIKILYEWTTKQKISPFSNNYIINNFCKPNGQSYKPSSINNYRWGNALTDIKD